MQKIKIILLVSTLIILISPEIFALSGDTKPNYTAPMGMSENEMDASSHTQSLLSAW